MKNSFWIYFQYWNIYNIRVLYIQYLIHNWIVVFYWMHKLKISILFPFYFSVWILDFRFFLFSLVILKCNSISGPLRFMLCTISLLFHLFLQWFKHYYTFSIEWIVSFAFFKGFLLDWFPISLLLFSSCQNCNALSERECYIKSIPILSQSYVSYPEILLQWLDIFQ